MDIFNKLSKKTGDSAKAAAQRMAKTVKEETEQFAKSASDQVTGNEPQNINTDQNQVSPIVEAMQQGTQQVSDSQHQGIHSQEKRRLDYLQKELEELRRRKKLEEEQSKTAEEKASAQEEVRPLPPLVEPNAKPKRGGGRMTMVQKKQRKTEIGRSAKG